MKTVLSLLIALVAVVSLACTSASDESDETSASPTPRSEAAQQVSLTSAAPTPTACPTLAACPTSTACPESVGCPAETPCPACPEVASCPQCPICPYCPDAPRCPQDTPCPGCPSQPQCLPSPTPALTLPIEDPVLESCGEAIRQCASSEPLDVCIVKAAGNCGGANLSVCQIFPELHCFLLGPVKNVQVPPPSLAECRSLYPCPSSGCPPCPYCPRCDSCCMWCPPECSFCWP